MGRPPKAAGVEREETREPMRPKMKAAPNWEVMAPEDGPEHASRLRIDPSLIPDGMAAQWVTDSIFGQPQAQRRGEFERKGWTPVHQEDFDGRFDGMFMKTGEEGEIKVDGLVLMMRPKELSDKAKRKEYRDARQQVAIKEQALTGGDIGTSLDSRHTSALQSNRISKSVERINIPEE